MPEESEEDLWAGVPDTPQGGTFFRYALVTDEHPIVLRFEEEPHNRKISTLKTTVWEARVKYRGSLSEPGDTAAWSEALLCPTTAQATPFKAHRPLKGKEFLLRREAGQVTVAALAAKPKGTPKTPALKED